MQSGVQSNHLAQHANLVGQGQLPQVRKIREKLERTGRTVGQVAMELERIDPVNFGDRISPRPLLRINGLKDDIVPAASTRALYAKAREPKKIIWYNTGRDVPTDKAARNALFWFDKHLKHKFYLLLTGGVDKVPLARDRRR